MVFYFFLSSEPSPLLSKNERQIINYQHDSRVVIFMIQHLCPVDRYWMHLLPREDMVTDTHVIEPWMESRPA